MATSKKEIVIYLIIIIICFIASQHLNVVVSGSMEPVFYRGDLFIVEHTNFYGISEFDPNTVQVGDIVVYDATWYNEPVIHRVINITDINGSQYFVIKGDNNPSPDKYYVTPSQIQAKVLTIGDQPVIIPKIGYVTIFLRGL